MLILSRRLARTCKTRRSSIIGSLVLPARLRGERWVLIARVLPLMELRRSRGMKIDLALACALRHEARRRRRMRPIPLLLLALRRLLQTLRVMATPRASAASARRRRHVAALARMASSSRRGYQRRGRVPMLVMRRGGLRRRRWRRVMRACRFALLG
jgi:hypothetical protein